MGLRDDAIAAATAAKEAREATARAVLAEVLAGADTLDLALVAEQPTRLIFCADDVCLGVRDIGVAGDRVELVADNDGWTRKGEVTSLASLGILLARETA